MKCATMATKAISSKPPNCNKFNRNYLQNFALAINNSVMNLDVDLIRPLDSGLRLNIEFFSGNLKSSNYQSFYQYSLDMCNLLNVRKINLFNKWITNFIQNGNFIRGCPFPANHYYIKNYNSSGLVIPSFFFKGSYRIAITLFQNKKE
ncbi:uncharacterized protein LOC116806522 [Drosophila grimshawi]|uniref:uncharacterized protein LOC116806522 n=1 Tax=Drosophila grimshawi TaxID=7222 RepID=UPI0013EF2892|nr:uncharacterized protein LOC116806522 [Drosophila grimshawi]